MSENDIITFLHFHKSGGTTIVSFFKNYRKHNPNKNGNPWLDNKIIKFWDYNKNEFNNFKIILNQKTVNFVCFEWNFFKLFNEIDYNNIELITCISTSSRSSSRSISNT